MVFKCSEKEAVVEYKRFSKLYDLDKYKYLYDIMQQIWHQLGFDENDFENDSCFSYKNLNCYIDKENGSYCEVIGSGWFSIKDRLLIHKLCYNSIRKGSKYE